MNLVLTNPWGFLGLLGIPALVLIYYLRRKSKVVRVSTLFLLKQAQRESTAGRRFEEFSNSIPFWLQLLGILLLTWILVEPRYREQRKVQQIAIVLDSSASMQPFKEGLLSELDGHLDELQGDASEASYIVLDHEARRPKIYQGNDRDQLRQNLEAWNPTDGALDPTASLRIARSLVGPEGVVVYLTDHDGPPLILSAKRLAVGEPRANVGFTGVTMDGGKWTAMVRNYSDSVQVRKWSLETLDQQRTTPKDVEIPPRKFVTIKGQLPFGQSRAVLRLDGDAFEPDDVLPLIHSKPRVARLARVGENDLETLLQRMARGFAHVEGSSLEAADIVLTTLDETQKPGSERALIADSRGGEPAAGRILVAEHPLVKGLNWQALSLRQVREFEVLAGDIPLVWLGEKIVVLLRRDAVSRKRQLLFGFDLSKSNALKLTATAVVLHRFCELIANNTLTPEAGSLETSQLIGPNLPESVTAADLKMTVSNLSGESQEMSVGAGFRTGLRAPKEVGFLSLTYQEKPLLEGAVHFADTREADLSEAALVSPGETKARLVETASREDQYWRWIVAVLLILLLLAWQLLSRSRS